MSLRDFIRQTKMLIEHGLYVTRGTANGGAFERPLEAARLEERLLFSASVVAPVAAEIADAGDALASALSSADDGAIVSPESGTLSDQQFLDLIADQILPPSNSTTPTDPSLTGDAVSQTEDPLTVADTAEQSRGVELVFVDTGIANYEAIVSDIRASSQSTRAIQIVLLDSTQDGLQQINLYMAGMTQTVDTVHFFTHGTDRALKLGSTWIDEANLAAHQTEIEQWRNVLSPDADLVFYGCDLAGGESGRTILENIALWADADVAASDDATGQQSMGGDWDLEYTIGNVDAEIIVSGELQREWQGLMASFVVTNTNDSGAGSLRQAILDANNLAGADTITFSIGSGVQTISLSSILPDITDTVTINGTTQGGFAGTPLIVITGNNTIQDGLRLYSGSDNSTIRGLVLQGFSEDAIDITTSGNTIRGNYIGTNTAGTAAAGNNNGINIWSGDNNVVGGTIAADRNLISGNSNVGIIISGGANNTQIYGNTIGLNAAGTAALGNTYHGIVIDTSNGTIIGGTTAGHRNVISGNGNLGIALLNADNSVIYGNYVGTNAAGTADVNGTIWNSSQSGIYIDDGSSGNQIGSTAAGARNIISGNNHYGVEILGLASNNNTVSGNYIGTDVTGLNAVGNSGGGVSFWNAGTGNVYRDNVISGNLNVGVLVGNSSTGATIQGNLIGLGSDGSTVVGNTNAGILVEDASTGTLIGTDADGTNDAAEGNTISGNSHGIIVTDVGTTGTTIQGNRIGTDLTGTQDRGNANDGVLVQNGASNTNIGGTAAGAGNLISGNNEGIELTGASTTLNTIQGNLIGLDASGTAALGNDFDGIHVSMGAHDNTIGGSVAGAGNTVASNGASGIQIEGSGSDNNTIQGNFVGTDITGLVALGNGNSGVKLGNSAANNLVGGTNVGAANLIAGNGQSGIEINSSFGNTVQGNAIGIGADGVTPLSNSMHGIDLNTGSSNNLIGGDAAGAGNIIAYNNLDGVSVDSTSGSDNTILGNSINANGARGIDLTDDGVTLNDVGDGDTGANTLQNFPVLTAVYSAGGNTRFRGSLNSTASTTYRIEFFASQYTEPRGYGEGEIFLGAISVTTDGSGNVAFDELLSGVTITPGFSVSATATVDLGGSYGNTSEFSLAFAAMGSPVLISAPVQGSETRVNTTTANDQDLFHNLGVASAVAMDEDGDTVVVWTSGSQDGSGTGVYGQRYDKDGNAVGGEFRINVTTANDQSNAVVAMDATGGFIVVWESSLQDGSGTGIFSRRYNSSGTALTGDVLINTTLSGNQRAPSVSMSEDGRSVITWLSGDGSSDGVWARVYNSFGAAVTGEFRVNSATSMTQEHATSAMDADGDFVVVWTDGSSGRIMGQRYSSLGVAQGSNFQVTESGSNSSTWPTVAMNDAGDFVVAWKSVEQSGAHTQMFFRQFDSSGSPQGGQVLIGTDTTTFSDDMYPVVAMDDVGNFVISWDESNRDGSGQGVYARRYDSSGLLIGNEFRVNTTTTGGQFFANVAMDDEGDFTVVFVGNQTGDSDLYMQRYLGTATTSENGGQASFHVVLDTAPVADVSVGFNVSDITESNSYVSGMTFTSADWNSVQIANLMGADDALFDGDINYLYYVDSVTSSDVLYDGLSPDGISLFNLDNEPPIIYVDTTSDSSTGSDTSSVAALLANKGADGKISLREAILAANNTAGTDYIHFNITDLLVSGAHTITLSSALPIISDTVILDATTDGDFSGTPIVVIDGNNLTTNGLTLSSAADGSTVQGFVIRDFDGVGIEIQSGSDGNTIAGNYVGSFDVDGNDAGLSEANTGIGIKILGANNTIGLVSGGTGNLIAGNMGDEIVISGAAASGNLIQANLIGTTADSTMAITSAGTGIFITLGATNNTIGGTAPGVGNVIGGNNWAGIEIKGVGTSGNVVQGNWIGTDSSESYDLGNNEQGIRTYLGATSNLLGGIDPGAGNVIAYNSKGVSIYSAGDSGNAILGNRIYDNIGIGIDLGNDGVTNNDSDDSDSGANELLNFPVLASASIVGSDTVITGTLKSTPSTTFRIEFYTSVAGDSSGHGEAETFLDAVTVTTDANGDATINLTLAGWVLTDGEIVTATATVDLGGGNFGSTSEFSANVIIAGNEDPVLGDGGSVTMSEGGTGSPFLGVGTVTDSDSADFAGGTLSASISSGSNASDTLVLGAVGGVTTSGTDVLVGGINVGTIFGGAAGVPLSITFNSNATLARVQSVYQAVSFASSDDVPILGVRTISVTITDGDGGTSNTATGDVDLNVSLNDAPTVTPSAGLFIPEDTPGVMSLTIADPDANGGALKVTLALANTTGTFSLGTLTGLSFTVGDGTNDTSMAFTGTLSDLNNALSSITYTPTTGFNGTDALQFTVDDQGNTGNGGAQAVAGNISITVDSQNDAPVLSGANNLNAIDEDDVTNNGTLVSDLISGRVTDPDPSPDYGIAVTAVVNTNGTWQYTVDNGSNWLNFGSVSVSTARLLTADAATRVRFVPNSNFNGTITNGITFAAWDGTSGVAGATANLSPATYLDQFNSNSYSNNNGTSNWTGSWTETDNSAGGAANGLIRVNSGKLEVKSDRSNDNVYRQADLSAATSASVSFSYQNSIVGSGDVVRFQVSGNGGASYTDLAIFTSSSNTGSGTLSFDITSYISSNTRVRMIVTSVDQTKMVTFDNIQISANSATGGTTAFSSATASSSLVVNSVNDEQVFSPGAGQSFVEGSSNNVVTTATLLTTDIDNTNNQLIYTLSILPGHGILKLNGVALGAGDSFTQAQVNAGQVKYDHDGTEGDTDSFSFSVDDGAGFDTGVLVNFQIVGVNDNSPVLVSNGGGASAGISVSENSTAVTTVHATDADLPAETLTYSITIGADSLDAARFTIDSVSGVLTFLSAPDFESPTDSDGDNVYVVRVLVSDGTLTDTQLISVTVTDVTSQFEVTTVADVDDSGLGASYTIEQLQAAGGGADGKISLREAIIAANTTAGIDTITFNIAGPGIHTISLASALPQITQAVIIDGWSEPDFSGAPIIQLDGTALAAGSDGLWISGGGSTVRGLIISGFADRGISITGAGGNTIVGNWIGTDSDGTSPKGNNSGLVIESSGNTIGGTTAATRNVISGNLSANISIQGATANNNVVSGNYIGTSADGTMAISSAGNGISIFNSASGNVIGGSAAGAGNLIAGASNIGIELYSGASGNSIIGNLLGVNASGTAVLTSGGVGVTVNNATNTIIGGANAGEGNIFGGFSATAIWALGASSDLTVQGNYFGTDSTGTATFSIGTALEIWDATNSLIGGTTAGTGNVIRNTTGNGINVKAPSSGVSILGNTFSNTTGLGIDLATDGVTLNDSDDSDSGANQLTNFPVITMAARSGANIHVEGTLKATASTQYRIEVFANSVGAEHSSGYGAGQRYLGFITVTTDAAGNATFSADITASVAVGESVSATATDASGNTSEFGANRIIVTPAPVLDLDANDSSGEIGADFAAIFVEDGSSVLIADPDAVAFDTDTSGLSRLTVTITNLLDGSNEILTADTSGTSLNSTFVSGVLTITGTANESEYQQVLRTITYRNLSQNADNTTRVLTVVVDDGVYSSNVATSRIQILTSNDAPLIQYNTLTISEGGSVVLTSADLFSTDPEQSTSQLTYTITGVSGGQFEFVANPGVAITSFTQAEIDGGTVRFVHDGNETAPAYDVTVSDGLLSNGPQSVVVTFSGTNDPPVMNSATFSVVENSTLGTSVGFATSTDPDAGDARNYTILSGNTGGAFGINASSGEIVVTNPAALDYETITSFSLTIEVADMAGVTSTAIITINVTNVSDNLISAISDADATNEIIAENSVVGTSVGITALATDADANDSITYSLTDDAGGRFAIDSVTGIVTVANSAALDFETATSHNITIRATSTDGSFSTQTFLIQLTDVNESGTSAISDVNAAGNSVAENSANGSFVGFTAFAADPDSTDSISYSLDNNAGGRFAIDSVTGIVSVANGLLLDREAAPSHTIMIRATSTDGSFAVLSVDISLIDVNEFAISAITDLDGIANVVAELSLQGTLTGITVSASDADATTNNVTYSLDDTAGGRFQIDAVTGIITVGSTALDYETSTSHSVIARATSADGSSTTLVITINVSDVNESGVAAVSDNNAAANFVLENSVFGSVVGLTAFATDPDGTDSISYSLDDSAGGRFQIDSVTGIVSVANGVLLDREQSGSHSIIVRASSTDGTFSTSTFTINVIDVNEFPVGAISDINAAPNVVAENSPGGTLLGLQAQATDADATSNTINYSLDDDAGGRFQIDSVTGIVTVAGGAVLDFETAPAYSIIVRATSQDASSTTQAFIITLLDTNDAPPMITPGQQFSVSELSSIGTIFGTVAAIDPDSVGILQSWTITSGNSDGIFAIDPMTGALQIVNTALLNFENSASYTLTLTVSDGSTTSLPQTVNIRIIDGNEAPIFGVPAMLTVDENSSAGTVVGAVTASDVDSGDSLSYSIVGSVPASAFAIDSVSGVLKVVDPSLLDFESQPFFTLQIQATDLGGLSTVSSVIVALNDLNEAPTMILLAGGSVQENRGAGSFVGQFSVLDPDAGDAWTWTLRDDANGTFVVNASSGRVDVAAGAALNFEQTSVYQITVEVTDRGGETFLQTFSINLIDVNDAPIAVSELVPGIQLTDIEVLTPGLLLNDIDEDGDTLQAVLVSTTANGTLLLRPDGSLLYTPNGVFSGDDTFVYYVTDGRANSAPVTVTIKVAPAVSGASTTNSGTAASTSESIIQSPDSQVTTENTETSTDSGDQITVVTITSMIAPPTTSSLRSENPTAPVVVAAELISDSGSPSLNSEDLSITGELLTTVFVSDFFGVSRSERIRSAATELAQAAVFGSLMTDAGLTNAIVSLNFFTIDSIVQRFDEPTLSEREELAGKVAVGSAAVVTTSLSVGYVIWILRGGSLLTTFMSAMPAWQAFDPLPVLQSFHKAVEEDDDSLLSIATRKTVDGLKKLRKG